MLSNVLNNAVKNVLKSVRNNLLNNFAQQLAAQSSQDCADNVFSSMLSSMLIILPNTLLGSMRWTDRQPSLCDTDKLCVVFQVLHSLCFAHLVVDMLAFHSA